MEFETATKICRLLSYDGKAHVVGSEWVMTNCPFAPKFHAKGKDEHPSFGINFKDNYFNCFSCGSAGKIETLPFQLKHLFPENNYEWLIELIQTGGIKASVKLRRTISSNPTRESIVPIPIEILNYFYPLNFTYKSITPEIARDYGVLRFYSHKIKSNAGVIIPIFTIDNKLVALKLINPVTSKRFYVRRIDCIKIHSNSFKKFGVLYGENEIEDHDRIYIVEGERDRILLDWFLRKNGLSKGRCVVASAGRITRPQVTKLKILTNYELVLLLDNDYGGKKIRELILKVIDTKALKVLEPKNYFGVNDPAEAYEKGIIGDLVSQKNLKEVRI